MKMKINSFEYMQINVITQNIECNMRDT